MDTPEIDALQNELGSLTCEEQKPSQLKKLPPCVFIALAQRYLTATQRAALAASERYAREELVKKGEIVWRVTSAYAPPRDHERAWGENVYHAITMMPAYGGKSFEELRLEDYQAAAMSGEGLRAANAAFAALAAERDRLVFRAPSPVAELRVTSDKPFVFGASVAEPPVVTPETHSDKPFAFGANATGQEEPFVFGAKIDK